MKKKSTSRTELLLEAILYELDIMRSDVHPWEETDVHPANEGKYKNYFPSHVKHIKLQNVLAQLEDESR